LDMNAGLQVPHKKRAVAAALKTDGPHSDARRR
jgi:hypothetical protein